MLLLFQTIPTSVLLYFFDQWKAQGLQELWLEFRHGDKLRHIPIHTLYLKIGVEKSRCLLKVHVLTGDDSLSKIGTKHAAFTNNPERYLSSFGESKSIGSDDMAKAERFLVGVWASAKVSLSIHTFNDLRVDQHKRKTKPLELMPPTSSVITGHIRRAFFVIRSVIILLKKNESVQEDMDPTNHGWAVDTNGHLLPEKCLRPLPSSKLIVCGCKGRFIMYIQAS